MDQNDNGIDSTKEEDDHGQGEEQTDTKDLFSVGRSLIPLPEGDTKESLSAVCAPVDLPSIKTEMDEESPLKFEGFPEQISLDNSIKPFVSFSPQLDNTGGFDINVGKVKEESENTLQNRVNYSPPNWFGERSGTNNAEQPSQTGAVNAEPGVIGIVPIVIKPEPNFSTETCPPLSTETDIEDYKQYQPKGQPQRFW